MLNFTETLDKTAQDIPKPPLQPVGTYRWMVEKHPEIVPKFKDLWDVVNYTCKCIGPAVTKKGEMDIDEDALHEFGDLRNIRQRISFFFSNTDQAEFDRALYNHKRFLVDTLKAIPEDGSIKEGMANAVNKTFVAQIKWKADKDDSEVFHANIGKTAPDA